LARAEIVTGSSSSGGATTGEIVLIVICIVLAVALLAVSLKYWRLRQELVGTYSVTSTASAGSRQQRIEPPRRPTEAAASYDNPLYSGDPADTADDQRRRIRRGGGDDAGGGGY